MTVEQVSSYVLEVMQQAAKMRLNNADVTKAVITVPAHFTFAQKKATQDAAKIAGLDVLRCIDEPTAAAMAAGFHKSDEDKNVVVFDFGGGTFDLSVLSISKGVINVEATRGDMNLGGRDLDEVVVNHCLEKFKEETGVDLSGDKRARGRLYPFCEQAKKNLSEEGQYTAEVRLENFHEDTELNIEISLDEFEELA